MSILHTGTFSERWGGTTLRSAAAAICWSPAAPAVAKVKRVACSGEFLQLSFIRDADSGGTCGNWLKVTFATSCFLTIYGARFDSKLLAESGRDYADLKCCFLKVLISCLVWSDLSGAHWARAGCTGRIVSIWSSASVYKAHSRVC